jgi:Uncharacterized protein related to plant photosystem II stability/assembly factor
MFVSFRRALIGLSLGLSLVASAQPPLVSFYSGQVTVRAAEAGQWQWHPLAIGNGGYNLALTFDPVDPDRIYLRSDVSGVIRTTNGGRNWMTSNIGIQGLSDGNYSVGAIAVDPVDPRRIYASVGRSHAQPSGIVRSDDGGESWRFISSDVCIAGEGPMARKHGGPGILVDPRDNARIYSVDTTRNGGAGGVFISEDEGATWRPSGLTVARVLTLRFHPENPDILFAAARNHERAPGGMFRSDDRGETWRRIGLEGKDAHNFHFERTNPSILYVTTGLDGVFKTADGGETWEAINNGLPLAADGHKGRYYTYTWRGIDTSPHRPGHVIVTADVMRAFYESFDYGATWQLMPIEKQIAPKGWMLPLDHMGWHTTNIYFHPTRPGTIFSCDFFATWRSDDGGVTWWTNPYGAENSCMVTVLPDVEIPNRIYLGLWDHDLMIYHDDPAKPRVQRVRGARQESRGTNHHASAIAQNASNPDQLLAVANSAVLIRSEDRGATWTRVDEGLPDDTYWRMGAPVFADAAGLAFVPIGSDEKQPEGGDGVFVSADGGRSWRRAANEGLGAIDVTGRWDPRQNVFATTPDASLLALVSKEGRLLLSEDRAETWREAALPAGRNASRVAISRGSLYVACKKGRGLWRSDDRGATWYCLWQPEELRGRATVELLAVDPKKPSRILMHTSEKRDDAVPAKRIAYRLLLSEDNGTTWRELHNDTLAIWRLRSIAFDPFDPDRILASTQWGGTWAARRPAKGN